MIQRVEVKRVKGWKMGRSGVTEHLNNKPVGDIDLREFIAVLRLDLYKYRDYPTGQKPCDNPQMRLTVDTETTEQQLGNFRVNYSTLC